MTNTNSESQPLQLEPLRRLSSCTVANAIERFEVRLRNTGFTDGTIRCMFPELPTLVGYAATARVRTSEPPMVGHHYYDRTDWWNHILSVPAPRIVVVEDVDERPGLGSFIGGIHATILRALGCTGVVTNGAVRDLPAIRAMNLQMFAGNLSVSHAYAHVFDFGHAITVGQMKVQPGDLVHGDMHGVQTVPLEIADKIPEIAEELNEKERQIIALCQSPDFTLEMLRNTVKDWK